MSVSVLSSAGWPAVFMPPQLLLQRGNSSDVTLKVETVQQSGPRNPMATGKTGHRIFFSLARWELWFQDGKVFFFFF